MVFDILCSTKFSGLPSVACSQVCIHIIDEATDVRQSVKYLWNLASVSLGG